MSQTSDTKPLAEPKEALPVTDPGASAGLPFEIAILALQNLTLFPETVIPLAVGRPRSMSALKQRFPPRKTTWLRHSSS
jgi:ATP-dependent Lon protease